MKKFFILALTFVCFVFSYGCAEKIGGYEHPEFKTEYTIAEHIERIIARTEERFAEELASGEIVDFTVEIVYAFYDNDPEYFLVELTYGEEFVGSYQEDDYAWREYATSYRHLLGYIENDYYRYGLYGYDDFVDGKSAYSLCGYEGAKKYYGATIQAVEIDGRLLQIFNLSGYGGVEFGKAREECFQQQVIPEERYKELMEGNFKLMPKNY